MRTLWILTVSAIKMFVRNKQALYFTFFFPVFLMIVLGLINFDRASKVELGLVLTGPPDAATRQFIEAVKSVPVFTIHEGVESEERKQLEEDNRAAVLIIPATLIPDGGSVRVLANANDPGNAATANNIIGGMLDKTALQLSGQSNRFTLDREEVNSRNLKYIDFLLPGLIALSVMQIAIFSVAFVFVTFKEKGILKRLIATPMSPISFVVSNVITRLIVTLIQTAIFIILGLVIFHVKIIGSYWLISLISLLGALMFLGIGFMISGLAKTVESVPVFANLMAFPMMFLGGIFFPIDSFPDWLQKVAKYLPLSFFSTSLRDVMNKGATLNDIYPDLLWMAVWAVVLVVLANFTFSFEEKRQ